MQLWTATPALLTSVRRSARWVCDGMVLPIHPQACSGSSESGRATGDSRTTSGRTPGPCQVDGCLIGLSSTAQSGGLLAVRHCQDACFRLEIAENKHVSTVVRLHRPPDMLINAVLLTGREMAMPVEIQVASLPSLPCVPLRRAFPHALVDDADCS